MTAIDNGQYDGLTPLSPEEHAEMMRRRLPRPTVFFKIKPKRPPEVEQAMKEFADLTQEQFIERIKTTLGDIANAFISLAGLIAQYEEKGFDMDLLRREIPISYFLRLVSTGQLCANAFRRLMTKPNLLRKVARLPLPDQEKIAGGEALEVAEIIEGNFEIRKLAVEQLTPKQISQVFETESIRTIAQQRTWIEEKRQSSFKGTLVSSNPNYAIHGSKGIDIMVEGKRVLLTWEKYDELGVHHPKKRRRGAA